MCPMPTGKHRQNSQGFIYIALLMGLAMISIFLSATSEVWTQTRQREKEEELLYVGNDIRAAITRFYQQSRRFPMTLDELVEDKRNPAKVMRFLRKQYADPMTNNGPWGEVRLPGGQLVGVFSLSQEAPLKVAGFALRDKNFADKEHYSEWVFRSPLPAANPLMAPGSGYTGQAGGASNAPTPPARNTPPTFTPPVPRGR